MEYIDCSITIREKNRISYLQRNGGKERDVDGQLDMSPLRALTVARLEHWIKSTIGSGQHRSKLPSCDLDDLKLIGCHLYEILFADDRIRKPFEEIVRLVLDERNKFPDRRLRLNVVFESGAQELARLPWEFLFVALNGDLEGGVFIAGERTELLLSRKIAPREREGGGTFQSTPPEAGALRVLLVFCTPDVIDGQRFPSLSDDEITELRQLLNDLAPGAPDRMQLQEITDPSYDELRGRIDEFRPHVLHYVGHGKPGCIALQKHRKEPDFDHAQASPQFRWVTSKQVRALFTNVQPRLVFLNACNTAASESLESFKGLIADLVRADVGGVIAMQYSIANEDALTFAKAFYAAVGDGRAIDEAAKLGRKELGKAYPPWEHPRFATPVVYVQNNDPLIAMPDESPGGASSESGVQQRAPAQISSHSKLVG